jgi:16S rRNA (guanine527-N7)-methyltransferase
VPEAAISGLSLYLDRLAAWNPRVNLTGARTPEERVLTLVRPVLEVAPLVAPGRVIDVGSGSGSPGLVLALLRPELTVVLIEPRAKRWAFLKDAARAAGREVAVFRGRHDQWPGPPAPTVLVRALALPLAALLPLVAAGGALFRMGGEAEAHPALVRDPGPPGVWVYRRRST